MRYHLYPFYRSDRYCLLKCSMMMFAVSSTALFVTSIIWQPIFVIWSKYLSSCSIRSFCIAGRSSNPNEIKRSLRFRLICPHRFLNRCIFDPFKQFFRRIDFGTIGTLATLYLLKLKIAIMAFLMFLKHRLRRYPLSKYRLDPDRRHILPRIQWHQSFEVVLVQFRTSPGSFLAERPLHPGIFLKADPKHQRQKFFFLLCQANICEFSASPM